MPTPMTLSADDETENPAPEAPSPDPTRELQFEERRTPSAAARLMSIYRSPGPYTSVYLSTLPLLPHAAEDLDRRWTLLRRDLEGQCAPDAALKAIDARLALPAPADTAAICVIAAADGSTVVEHGAEPPHVDVGVVDTLPYVGPLLEWHQRRIPHLVVTVDAEGADIVTFGPDHFTDVTTIDGDIETMARLVSKAATAVQARVVVVSGEPETTQPLADAATRICAPGCNIITSPRTVPDDLADWTVRHVSDAAARSTVGLLREFRFLAAHDAAVDGTDATIAALVAGTDGTLLIHDDPEDQRRIWIGKAPFQLSAEKNTECREQARLVDAAIWSAVMQGIDVHVIPRTGPAGPDDDAAVIDRRGPSPELG